MSKFYLPRRNSQLHGVWLCGVARSVDHAAQYLAICFGDCLASGVTYVITTAVSKTMDVPSRIVSSNWLLPLFSSKIVYACDRSCKRTELPPYHYCAASLLVYRDRRGDARVGMNVNDSRPFVGDDGRNICLGTQLQVTGSSKNNLKEP